MQRLLIYTYSYAVIKCPGLSQRLNMVMWKSMTLSLVVLHTTLPPWLLLGGLCLQKVSEDWWLGWKSASLQTLYNTFYVCLSHLYLFAVIKCAVPVAPKYGFVTVSHYRLDGVARYTCKPGYKLVGVATRKCYYDKSWTGVAPICKRK